MRAYFGQCKPVHGLATFLRLGELSSNVAEWATYDIGGIANGENIDNQVRNKTQEAKSSLFDYTAYRRAVSM